jgi:hypothetical protein
MIAEDDLFMADLLEDLLAENRYDVCGIARTVDGAIALCGLHKPALAVLDVRQLKAAPELASRPI